MTEPFLAEIRIFGNSFAVRGWSFCDGSLLEIAQNTALFSLLGTVYGGNGRTNFALPNLQGRVAMGAGDGPGLSRRSLGQHAGVSDVTLTANQMPAHNHTLTAQRRPATSNQANNNFWARPFNVSTAPYGAASDLVAMSANALPDPAGGNSSHTNLQPYQVLSFQIALVGAFPQRG